MASSVSSSTPSILPKKRKLSTSSMPPEIAAAEMHLGTESSIDSTTLAALIPSKQQRKASHDSTHVESIQSEDAEALATLPSIGSFNSAASGLLKLPDVVPRQPPPPVTILQNPHSNLPTKKRKIVVDDNASITAKETLSFDQQSVVTKASATSNPPVEHHALPPLDSTSALDHLDALGDEAGFIDAALSNKTDSLLKDPPVPQQQPLPPLLPNLQLTGVGDDNSSTSTTLGSSNHRLLLEALKMTTTASNSNFNHAVGYGRDRLESWGGMSDLSVTGMGSDMGAAALAASALHHTGIIDDVTQAAAHFGGCADSVASSVSEDRPMAPTAAAATAGGAASVPSRISLGGRDRKWSVASLSEVSASGVPFLTDPPDYSMHSTDVQAFVAAATLADQLSELAGAVEAAASSADSVTYQLMREAGITSDASSVASPLIGAMNDNSSLSEMDLKQRSRSSTVVSFSQQIAVDIDYDAVAAAVDAAEAVTCALDLTAIASIAPSSAETIMSDTKYLSGKTPKRHNNRRQLPLNKKRSNTLESLGSFTDPLIRMRSNTLESLGSFPDDLTCNVSIQLPPIPPIPSSTLSDRDLEAIRERARAAAGYVPPTGKGQAGATTPPPRAPFKKRAKRQSPEPDVTSSTPKLSNTSSNRLSESSELEVDLDIEEEAAAAAAAAADAKGPANLKWEEMYQTLLSFIDDRRDEETKDLSESDKATWIWDGNVPTNYKTRDGKALGRWINNQRSAKAKGALKLDRESRLVDTGLRWSVLTSNSWNKMLEELKIYAEEQVRWHFTRHESNHFAPQFRFDDPLLWSTVKKWGTMGW